MKSVAIIPAGLIAVLAYCAFFVGSLTRQYIVYRNDDGSVDGWNLLVMIVETLFITAIGVIPLIGALLGVLVGFRRGARGSVAGALIGALTAPMVLAILGEATHDATARHIAAISSVAGAFIALAAVLHYTARRRATALNTEGSQPPG